MSKELYLIRHAKSSWEDNAGLDDINRPLQQRGVNDAIKMGQFFSARNLNLDKLISSNAVRALHTATIMAKEMHTSYSCLEINSDLYHANTDDLLRVIQGIENQIEKLAIFSHNPGISDFALNSNTNISHVCTNGVLCYKIKLDSWNNLHLNDLEFLSYHRPKDLI
jgi:phosphohistidine phosphatase